MKSKFRKYLTILSSHKAIPYYVIILIGLTLCLPIMRDGVITGHDLLFHIYRDHSALNSLKDGQLIPQVDPQALDGFGYSWNMFYGPLSTYVTAFLRVIVGSWPLAINLFIILTVITSGIFIYRFIHEVTKRRLPALFVSILYMAAPYHLVDIYIRQAQGELLPFVFAPILFHGLYRAIHHKKGFILIAIGFAGIILSHNISALIFGLFAALYALLNVKQLFTVASIKNLVIAGFLTLGLSAIYTLPLVELKQVGNYGVFDSAYMQDVMDANPELLKGHSLTVGRLFYNPVTVTGGSSEFMPFSLGLVTFVGLAMFTISYKKMPKKVRKLSQQSLMLALVSLLLTTNLIPWDYVPKIFYNIQFPWRFLMASIFFLSIVVGLSFYYTFEKILTNQTNKLISLIVISALAIYSSAAVLSLGTYAPTVKDKPLDYSLNNQDILMGQWVDQYSSIRLHTGSNFIDTPHTRIPAIVETLKSNPRGPIITQGDASVDTYAKRGLHLSFNIQSNTPTTIELPVLYYPGYKAYATINNSRSPLNTEESSNGLVSVQIPANKQAAVYVDFGISNATLIGAVLSFCSVVFIVVYGFIRRKTTLHQTKE